MKKVVLAVMVTAVMCTCLSCDKSSSLLIGKWNWVNPYTSPSIAAYYGSMALEFTSSNFSLNYYNTKHYSKPHAYANGTYEYNKSTGILTLYPTEGDYWGDDTKKTKYYEVQTLNESTLILVYVKNGSITEFTR